jgi:RNA recognition motif-containing protein
MTNIFIANLDWDISSDDLKVTFTSFGKVLYAHVVFDAKTKKSKGFGYIEMETADGAIAAIQALNGMDINGRKLDVKIASPKSNRPLMQAKKKEESKQSKK